MNSSIHLSAYAYEAYSLIEELDPSAIEITTLTLSYSDANEKAVFLSDSDGDGVPDAFDVCPGYDDNLDFDGDGIPDGCDEDDDNDGISDLVEGLMCTDTIYGSVIINTSVGEIATYDLATNTTHLVCNLPTVFGDIGINSDGSIYGINFFSSPPEFHEIDTNACSSTSLGTLPNLGSGANSLSFLSDGTALVGYNGSPNIYRVTPSPFSVSLWATITGFTSSGDFVQINDALYYLATSGSSDQHVLRITMDSNLDFVSYSDMGTLPIAAWGATITPNCKLVYGKDDEIRVIKDITTGSLADTVITTSIPSISGIYGFSSGTETANCSDICTHIDTDMDGMPNHQDLDSDGDGCFDVKEAGFTDGDDDGELGSSPLTVDAMGIVTSGIDGYTSPHSDLLFEALSPCLEICANGVDDNNDGRVDETYPGGVEENILVWLDAGYGFGASIWLDKGKNERNATYIGDPTQIVNGQNYNPSIQFDGDDAVLMDLPELVFDGSPNNVVLFIVYQKDNSSTANGIVGNQISLGFNNIFIGNSQIGTGGGAGAPAVNSTIFSSDYHLVRLNLDEEDIVNITAGSSTLHNKGNALQSFSFNEVNTDFVNPNFYLGSSGTDTGSQFMNGKISEFIVFWENDGSLALDANEIEKIESYLSIKYGLNRINDILNSQ
ncbi:MAG: hypothetical protein AAF487_03810 [Bacteroidota bacterium]